MKNRPFGHKPPALLRWGINALSTLLVFLWVWLFGFVLSDLGNLKGPDYETVEAQHVDVALVRKTDSLKAQIQKIDVQIRRQKEIQGTLEQSMNNARSTMDQMMNLHRLSLERELKPSSTQQEALSTAQERFLKAQEQYEQANSQISASSQNKFELSQELNLANDQLEEQRIPARKEFAALMRTHRLRVASFKLAFILPVFLISAWLVYLKRRSPLLPVFMSGLIASFWTVGVVMFEHFPREFFKYLAIIAAITIVLAFLIWLVSRASAPGRGTLMKRFREAYSSHHCPICAYPIVRGALKQALWTRRGPRLVGANAAPVQEGSAYACPSCGTDLYENCEQCGAQRHSLLPFCDSCGEEKHIPELSGSSPDD